MPFQILMAFHFLESRKRQSGAAFLGVEIFSDPNAGPSFRSSSSEPTLKAFSSRRSQRSRNNGAAARETRAGCPAPFPGPVGRWLAPLSQADGRGRQGWDPRQRRRDRAGADARTARPSHKCEKMARAEPPRRCPTLSGGPGAGPGKEASLGG